MSVLDPLDEFPVMSIINKARDHIYETITRWQHGEADTTELLMTVAKAHEAMYGKQLTHAAVLKVVNTHEHEVQDLD